MLELLKSDDGTIRAVCEYYLVDINGNFNRNGEYVWISEVEIAPQYRGNGALKSFAKMIMDKYPQAKFGYFHRQKKYPGRKIRLYHKARWLKLIGGNNAATN